jgi:ribosomal protein L12E/L44/L45/RPP1/RPP2
MEIRKFIFRLFFFFVAGTLTLSSCKKDSSTSNVNALTNQQSIQVQNSDAQDAVADKTEEDIDSKLDELQNNNYAVAGMKSYLANLTDTVVITVDHPDTTTLHLRTTAIRIVLHMKILLKTVKSLLQLQVQILIIES